MKLIERLSNGTQELVKLDLSHCNLTSECIVRLNQNAELIGGIAELNLGGNAISLEVWCSSLIRCCRVFVLWFLI